MKVLTERCCFRVAWMHVDAYGFHQKHPGTFPFGFHCRHLRWCKLAGIVFNDFFLHNSLKNWSFNQTIFNCLQLCPYLFIHLIAVNTVDERHPAPFGMYKNPVNTGINYIYVPYQLVIARFLPSTVSLHLANETILNSPGLHRPLGHLSSFLCRLCRPLHLVSAGLQVYIYICISTKVNTIDLTWKTRTWSIWYLYLWYGKYSYIAMYT